MVLCLCLSMPGSEKKSLLDKAHGLLAFLSAGLQDFAAATAPPHPRVCGGGVDPMTSPTQMCIWSIARDYL